MLINCQSFTRCLQRFNFCCNSCCNFVMCPNIKLNWFHLFQNSCCNFVLISPIIFYIYQIIKWRCYGMLKYAHGTFPYPTSSQWLYGSQICTSNGKIFCSWLSCLVWLMIYTNVLILLALACLVCLVSKIKLLIILVLCS